MDACRACLWLHETVMLHVTSTVSVDQLSLLLRSVAVLQVARRRAVYLASADIRCRASIITVSCVNDLGRNRRNSGRSTCLFIMIAFAATSRDVWLASRYLWYKTGKFTGIHWCSPRDTCLVLRRFKTRFNVCVWAVSSRPSRPCLLCVPAFHCHVVVQWPDQAMIRDWQVRSCYIVDVLSAVSACSVTGGDSDTRWSNLFESQSHRRQPIQTHRRQYHSDVVVWHDCRQPHRGVMPIDQTCWWSPSVIMIIIIICIWLRFKSR